MLKPFIMAPMMKLMISDCIKLRHGKDDELYII